jgi:hypothetical protein
MLYPTVLAHFSPITTKSKKAYCWSLSTYRQFSFICYWYCICGNIRRPWWLIQHVPISRMLLYNQIMYPAEKSVASCRDKVI